MPDEELESLWSYGDPEPWRRGRFAIGFISLIILLGFLADAVVSLSNGNVDQFFLVALSGCGAAFLLFLIWIGQNWARWIIAPFFALAGAWAIVWGIIHEGIGLIFLLGIGALIIFSYLAFAPAVYAFARRQRENIGWLEIAGAGAACFLLIGSVVSGALAFHFYKSTLEESAMEFAELTFQRVFINRDAYFLEEHSSAARKYSRPGELINRIDAELGEVRSVGPFVATMKYKLDGRTLRASGQVRTRALFAREGYWVTIQIAGTENHWEIEHLSWEY